MNLSKKSLVFVIASSGLLLLYRLYIAAGAVFSMSRFLPGLLPDSNEAGAVGIIGGADGSTAIFTATRFVGAAIPETLLLLVEISLYVFLLVKAIKALRK